MEQQYPLMKGKLKFLRRSLVLGPQDEAILQKVRQKGLYVKCVKDLEMNRAAGKINLRKHKYLKGKLVNCLTKLVIRNSGKYEWYNILKYARNIQTLSLQFIRPEIFRCSSYILPTEYASNKKKKSVEKFLQCLKKLPKGIQGLGLEIDELKIEKGHLNKLYRIIGSFKHLERYNRMLGFQPTDVSYVFKELVLIKNYLSKAREFKKFRYNFRRNHPKSIQDQHEFLAIMKYGRQCPWVTDFKIQLEPDVTLDVDVKEETSVDYTEEERAKYEEAQWEDDERFGMPVAIDEEDEEVVEEDDDDETEENRMEKLKQETAIFFRFDLFPNLRKLVLQFHRKCFYPLDDFVVKGFSALKNLKHLVIIAKERPQGARFLFEGLLEVPLLEMINLKMPFIKGDEWELLKRFFDKQVDLKAITLEILKSRSTKEGYLEQNKCFAEYVGGYLSKKPKLEYVCLRSKLLTVEVLSEALKKVEIRDQLKLFRVSLFDDHLITEKLASERVKGLCDFLISQKESLCYLSLNLLFILESAVIQQLTRAISQMKVLIMLELFINADRSHDQVAREENIEEQIKFFKKVMKKPNVIENYGKFEDYFEDIAKMLRALRTLDDLGLFCFFLQKAGEEAKKEFIEILKAFPEMKKLRNLNFNIPFKIAPKYLLKEVEDSLMNTANLKTGEIYVGGNSLLLDSSYAHHVNRIIDEVNQRQQLRSDLMF